MKRAWEHGLLWMLVGLLPLWQGIHSPGLPREGDALLHGYRALEMARMWRAGIWYPRWAPDLAGGVGYPLFIFHAPLFPWTVAALSVGLGLSIEQAMKLALMIAGMGGSIGIYLLARRWGLSPAAAMVAGLAFGYMPFQLQQTNYPQYLGITILPWLLLGVDGALRGGGFGARWLLALAAALLILAHNLTALMGGFLAFAYAISIGLLRRPDRRRWAKVILALGLGVGMSLPYLGPSLIEIPLVHLERARTGAYEPTRHFLSLSELLRLPPLRDERWGNRPPILTIGLHQALLALPSLVYALPTRRRRLRVEVQWAWGIGWMLALLMLPISRPLWEALPALSYLQFPWRWLGPLGVVIALLIGCAIEAVHPTVRWPAACASALALILGVLGLIYDGGSRASLAQVTLQDLHRYERAHGYPGLTATGELFPRWVEGWPELPPMVIHAYGQGQEPPRLDLTTLPPGAMIRTLRQEPLDQMWEVQTERSAPIRFWVLAYPGWLVTVDGRPTPMWVEAHTGWLWSEIPSGTHQVRLRFQGRWIWRLFDGIALGIWLGWPTWAVLRRLRSKPAAPSAPMGIIYGRTEGSQWGIVGALAGFLLTIGLHFPHNLWTATRVPLDHPPGADTSIQADFEGRIRLVGYQSDQWVARPGDTVRMTLWWRALKDLNEDAHVYVHAIPAERPSALAQAFQSDHMHPGDVPTRRWDPEKHYRDIHVLTIPQDISPGPYRIRVGIYGGPTNARWRVEESGADGVDLPQVLVIPRPMPAPPAAVTFGGILRLSGLEGPTAVSAGQPLSLWLEWQALQPIEKNYTLFVHVLNEEGRIAAQQDLFQLTSMWPAGVRIPLRVDLSTLPPGRYRIRIGWYLWPSLEPLMAQTPSGEAPYWELPWPQPHLEGAEPLPGAPEGIPRP